jgi:hypothetical protein
VSIHVEWVALLDGLAKVQSKLFLPTKSGKSILSRPFFQSKQTILRISTFAVIYILRILNIMIPCRFDAATPFNTYDEKDYATVLRFGLQFRINTKGEIIWRVGPDEQ